MKKILGIYFIISSALVFAQENLNNIGEIHSRILENRGKEQFRKNIIFKKFGRNGYSGSNQYLEYLGEIKNSYHSDISEYDVKTKGFLMGTNSNLLSNPDVYIGVNLGYLKSNLEYPNENSKVRTYGIEYYVGKNIGDITFIGKGGYSESKNIYSDYKYRTKAYSLGVETGYLFNFSQKSTLYPYIALDWNQYSTKAHNDIKNNDERLGSSSLGAMFAKEFFNNFLFTISGEWKYDFSTRKSLELNNNLKIENLKVGRDNGIFNVKLGYYIKPDFLISLGYSSFLNKEYYYDMFSFTLSHNF